MLDLHVIADTFRVMSQCVATASLFEPGQGDTHGVLQWLRDPHPDADAWIAASEEKRVELRAIAEAKHAALIRDRARERIVSREDYLARKRRDMKDWRDRNKPEDKARQKAWREANREYCRAKAKAYRARLKIEAPAVYAAYQEKAMARNRAKRAEYRAANPLPPPMTKSEKLEKKRAYRQRCPPKKRVLTPEQVAIRNANQKARYHAMSKEAKEAKLARKREAWAKRDADKQKAREEYLKNRRAA